MVFEQFLDSSIEAGMPMGRLSPPGKQLATIIKVEDKPVSSGGKMVQLELAVDNYSETFREWCIYDSPDDWKWKKGQAKLRLICESAGLSWPITNIQLLAGRKIGIDKINETSEDSFDDNGNPWVNTKVVNYMAPAELSGGVQAEPVTATPATNAEETPHPAAGTGEDAPW